MIDTPGLLVNLAVALIAALIGAAAAIRLGQSTMVGYIVAGIAIGPFTPGFVGDADVVRELADIGVIFLMFAIGARISFGELLKYRWVALVGGSLQVLVTLGVGALVGLGLGWGIVESLFLGAVVSNSSSTVLAKVLGERGEGESEHGHIGLAWSTVQDTWTVILIVLLSSLAGPGVEAGDVIGTVGTAVVYLVAATAMGAFLVPRYVEFLAGFRSREVFVIGIVGLALGVAYLGTSFGISLALGAFLAGILVAESDLSHRVVAEAMPFRDLFAGLFFVSVGMLVDPGFVIGQLPLVILGVALIVVAKGIIVGIVARAFRYPLRTSLLVAVILAQSAEFSFLLARVGADLGAVSDAGFNLMIASAAITIALAPILRRLADPIVARLDRRATKPVGIGSPVPPTEGTAALICGYGRIGRLIAGELGRREVRMVIIESERDAVETARREGHTVVAAPAEDPLVLEAAGLAHASVLVVAVPDPVAARIIVQTARDARPDLRIVARTHSVREQTALEALGASEVVVGEVELGLEMTRFVLRELGVSADDVDDAITGLRSR